MVQQGAWTFRYSLEGFLKRTLFLAGSPRTESELIDAVLSDWAGQEEKSRDTIQGRVRASLSAKNGAFRQVADDAFELRTEPGDDLQEQACQFLKETGIPQKQGEILRHLEAVTGHGRGDLMSRIDLDADPRFGRLESGEWLLTEWELVNDAIAGLMVEFGQRRAHRDDLLELISDGDASAANNLIFQPELDSRFAVVDDHVECLLVEPEAAATAEPEVIADEDKTHTVEVEEVTHTETEELQMNATATTETNNNTEILETGKVPTHKLVDTVLAQLTQAAEELSERNQGLSAEVVSLFNSEDLDGIKGLMTERKRLEALSEDLQLLVLKWTEDMGEK